MILSDIVTLFRIENPDITDRVISDALLKKWCLTGDKEVCAITRCIVGDTTFNSVVSASVYNTKYDLTGLIPKFYDIDDFPGGGVSFDDDPLEKTTVSQLDADDSSWRERSAGTPEKWYRRGKYLYFDYPVLTADLEIRVYAVSISDDFNNDNITPYNQLTYLEPFHYGINKYLMWKAKEKIGKDQEKLVAKQEFYDYCSFMKKQLGGNKFSSINIQPKAGYY